MAITVGSGRITCYEATSAMMTDFVSYTCTGWGKNVTSLSATSILCHISCKTPDIYTA